MGIRIAECDDCLTPGMGTAEEGDQPGMGEGLTPEELGGSFQRIADGVAAKFTAGMTNMALYKAVQPELDRADKFVAIARTMRNLTPGRLDELLSAVSRLRGVRNRAKVRYANTPNNLASGDDVTEARSAAIGPIRWVAAIAGQTLTASNARAEFVRTALKNAKAAPGDALAWGLDSIARALHVPTWLIPVAAVSLVGLYVAPFAARQIRRARGTRTLEAT